MPFHGRDIKNDDAGNGWRRSYSLSFADCDVAAMAVDVTRRPSSFPCSSANEMGSRTGLKNRDAFWSSRTYLHPATNVTTNRHLSRGVHLPLVFSRERDPRASRERRWICLVIRTAGNEIVRRALHLIQKPLVNTLHGNEEFDLICTASSSRSKIKIAS